MCLYMLSFMMDSVSSSHCKTIYKRTCKYSIEIHGWSITLRGGGQAMIEPSNQTVPLCPGGAHKVPGYCSYLYKESLSLVIEAGSLPFFLSVYSKCLFSGNIQVYSTSCNCLTTSLHHLVEQLSWLVGRKNKKT